jgi:lipoprotein NlpD
MRQQGVFTIRLSWMIGVLVYGLLLGQAFASAPVFDHTRSAQRYVVQPGDTLYSIAFSVGMDYRLLAAANGIVAPYSIHRGQVLRLKEEIPQPAPQPAKKRQLIVNTKHTKKRQEILATPTPAVTHVIHREQRVLQWQWPAQGRVSKAFHLTKPVNAGINFAGIFGAPIKATAGGQVVYSGHGIFGYGNLIIVQHNSMYLSAYAFNQENLVKEGQWVQQGQVIARMGGAPKKGALHFEIRKRGKPVNPLKYLSNNPRKKVSF